MATNEREVAAYVMRAMLSKQIEKMKNLDYLESDEFQEFMASNYPTYRLTATRFEKMIEHFGKIGDRALKPVETTIKSYEKK